jgi:hypothetical protein
MATTPVNLRLDDGILEGIAAVGRAEDRNLSGTIRLLVRESLKARHALPSSQQRNEDDSQA